MITIDNKEYDETKLSDTGKVAFSQLQQIKQKQISLTMDFQNTQILQNHYGTILKEELPKDVKPKIRGKK
jgi:hypothetical protein